MRTSTVVIIGVAVGLFVLMSKKTVSPKIGAPGVPKLGSLESFNPNNPAAAFGPIVNQAVKAGVSAITNWWADSGTGPSSDQVASLSAFDNPDNYG